MTETEYIKKRTTCRVCKGLNLVKVLDFGPTPLANEFLKENQIDKAEYFYPLEVHFCNTCNFIQLGHVVDPKLLFGSYVYVSSTSQVFVQHFKYFAKDAIEKFKLNKNSLVIDIGSNDGILLEPYKRAGIPVLGIEPAKHIAKIAQKKGIDTIAEFFSSDLARKIVKTKKKANLVTATNVFAHIDDLDEVIKGLDILLDENGVFIMEAPYIVDFIEKKYFDLVYHEHLSYWGIKSLVKLFDRFNMKVFKVEKVNVHGGSIRVFVKKNKGKAKIESSVKNFLNLEKEKKISKIDTYISYANDVLENKVALLSLLVKLKKQNKKIVGYGAPAKGNTLLNYFKIGKDILDYAVDDSSFKQGLYTPGTRIQVVPSLELKKEKPDYILILAWNFAESIMKKLSWFHRNGGKFIIPAPKPKII